METNLQQQSLKVRKKADNKKFNGVKNIENSPFSLVSEGEEYFIALGNYKLKTYKTEKEAEKDVKNKSWELLLTAAWAYNQLSNEVNNIHKRWEKK